MKKTTKSNRLVLDVFVSILGKTKNEILQFLLSICISAEKQMVIWVYGLSFSGLFNNYPLIRTINIS